MFHKKRLHLWRVDISLTTALEASSGSAGEEATLMIVSMSDCIESWDLLSYIYRVYLDKYLEVENADTVSQLAMGGF